MAYRVELSDGALSDLDRIASTERARILRFLRDRLGQRDDPRGLGQALKVALLGDLCRWRVGDYRIIGEIHDDVLVILVVRIAHRREVYR